MSSCAVGVIAIADDQAVLRCDAESGRSQQKSIGVRLEAPWATRLAVGDHGIEGVAQAEGVELRCCWVVADEGGLTSGGMERCELAEERRALEPGDPASGTTDHPFLDHGLDLFAGQAEGLGRPLQLQAEGALHVLMAVFAEMLVFLAEPAHDTNRRRTTDEQFRAHGELERQRVVEGAVEVDEPASVRGEHGARCRISRTDCRAWTRLRRRGGDGRCAWMQRVALVTGCRSGFGLGVARRAAERGYVVYAGLRDFETRHDLERATAGLSVIPLQLDVTRGQERDAAVDRIRQEQGRLDALVNNAGMPLGGFLEQVDEDELRELFDVNVFGAWAMTKACLPLMRASGGGNVVMVSSMSGRTAIPGLGAYAGSKFALEGLSEAWRHELAMFGIHVVCVEPGAYRTDIFGRNRKICRKARDPESPYAPYIQRLDELFARTVDKIARDPQEVCDRIVALMSEAKPGFRHPMGPGARPRAMLLRLVPFAAMELAVRRAVFKRPS